MKLWLNENDFIELDDRKSLTAEIAPRSRSFDWMGIMGLLPDPDPVLAKLGQDITVYRQLLSDAHVWSCAQSRKSGTLSCEWEIRESATGGVRTNRKAHQMIEEMMSRLDVYQIITDMLDAPFFGMSPIEVIWTSGNNWLPDRVVGKPPEWFAFDADNRLRFLSLDNMIDGEELPLMKFLLPRHHATYQNPYGERVLSRCFWPVTFKRGGFKFWAIFTEKYGMPWIIGKVPRQANDTERGLLLTRLVNMVQDAAAVINNDESVGITEAAGKTASAGIYEQLISVSNREISKAVLGQTLTTELDQGGSFAATKEHMEVRADLVDQDKRMVSAAFNRLFSWVTELNFAGAAPPEFAFYEEENIQKDRSERDTQLTGQGVRFTPKYYQRTYNLEEDDFDLADPGGMTPDNTDDTTTSFAQGDEKKNPFLREIQAQQSIDSMADHATATAVEIFENYQKQIQLFLNTKTLNEARNQIVDLYDKLDPALLADILSKAIMDADWIGKASVSSSDFVETLWGPGQPFAEAIDYFKAKSFTISGVAKADLLADVKDEIIKAMKEGQTADMFRKSTNTIFDKHGYSRLNPYRIDTLFRTNMQTAYQAGRYRQMTSAGVLAARPYWRYIAVLDGSTRPTHAAMHGKIFKHDHSFWKSWYPPNGFNCRCTVQTVSEREIEREGWNVENQDPTGGLVEPIDPETGNTLLARPLMPDPGWGGRPSGLQDLFEDQKARSELSAVVWKEKKDQPGPDALGRMSASKIAESFWKKSPKKAERLEDLTKAIGKTAAFQKIEAEFKHVMGISPNETFGVIKDPLNEIVRVDINSLAHAMLDRNSRRERFLLYLRQTIEDPYEILLTEYETARQAKTKIRKKYIGLFADEKKEAVVIVAEISLEGWVMYNVMNAKQKTIDRQRRGIKVLWGK